MMIRRLLPADLLDADRVLQSAYGPGRGRRLERLRRYMTLEPNGWFCAVRGGELVGLGGAVCYGPFAYLGLMAVHQDAQREGIGRRIAQAILDWLDESGCGCVLLEASPSGAPLYASLGFAEDDKTVLLKSMGPDVTASEHLATVRPLQAEELDEVVAFDAAVFGAARAKVMASYLGELSTRAWTSRDRAGQLTGYLIAQNAVLGPWAASSSQAAEALLGCALRVEHDEPPIVMIPSSNVEGLSLLRRSGFEEVRTLSHMRRGGGAPPGQRHMLYGRASFAVG